MPVRFNELVDRVSAALTTSGWTVVGQAELANQRLARLRVAPPGMGASASQTLILYAWSSTHGGKTRPDDEFRVQMTRITPPLLFEPGASTLLLGLSLEEGVTTAWDPTFHVHFTRGSSSLQTRRAAIDTALRTGWGFHQRGNGEIAVSFLDEHLGAYLMAQTALHRINSPATFGELEGGADEAMRESAALHETTIDQPFSLPIQDPVNDETSPDRLVRYVCQSVRDQSFSRRVLAAYGHACCGCGAQLGIVQGAHIVPVAVRPNFSTRNGIALCANHHLAYDRGLFAIEPDFSIRINERLVRAFRMRGQAARSDLVLDSLDSHIALPADEWNRPAEQYLLEAAQHRTPIRD